MKRTAATLNTLSMYVLEQRALVSKSSMQRRVLLLLHAVCACLRVQCSGKQVVAPSDKTGSLPRSLHSGPMMFLTTRTAIEDSSDPVVGRT